MADEANTPAVTDDPKPADTPADTPAPDAKPVEGGEGQPATVLNGGGKDTPAPAAPATWPDDWRQKMAGGDERLLKRLERMADPTLIPKAWLESERKLSATRPQAPPAADAPPEEIAAYREANGIPKEPAGYLKDLPDGLVIGKADKPLMEKFVADMHGQNAPAGIVHSAIASYYRLQEEQAAERAGMDARAHDTATTELKASWGGDYTRNINALNGWLDTAGAEVKHVIANARGPDGTPLFSNPAAVRWFTAQMLEANPLATIVPAAGGNAGKGVEERMAEIRKVMRTDRAAYDKDPKLQAEFLELTRALERVKQKAA